MKHICILSAALSFTVSGVAAANPVCEIALDSDAVGKKYRKVAPLYHSADSGWIVASNQLNDAFEMDTGSANAMGLIAEEFARKSIPFGVLVTAPRPAFVPETDAEAIGLTAVWDAQKARESFTGLIAQLNEAGVVAPNTLEAADNLVAAGHAYTFMRDTHWTALGASASMNAMAQEMKARFPEVYADLEVADFSALELGEMQDEKGSLAGMMADICDVTFEPETFPTRVLAGAGDAGGLGLLGDEPQLEMVLAGTSYSDRYKTDHYRSAASLEHEFATPVRNVSLTGGGFLGSIETFILNDGLDEAPSALIWEVPYTQRFSNEGALRQLHGALIRNGVTPLLETEFTVSSSEEEVIRLESDAQNAEILRLSLDTLEARKIVVRVYMANGDSLRLRMDRSNRVPEDQRSAEWFLSLQDLGAPVERLKIEYDADKMGETVAVMLGRRSNLSH